LIADLVAANHILFDQGVVDGFGHVSVRHDKQADRYLLSRSMAPALVQAADIMEFELDSTPVAAAGRTPYLERFIHGAIYRARPDVMAVVHSHSTGIIPFGVAEGAALRPVFHLAGFLGPETPVFEIRDVAGPATDLLVRSDALGDALARTLGGRAVGADAGARVHDGGRGRAAGGVPGGLCRGECPAAIRCAAAGAGDIPDDRGGGRGGADRQRAGRAGMGAVADAVPLEQVRRGQPRQTCSSCCSCEHLFGQTKPFDPNMP